MASMLSGAMAAVGQARTDATAALERGVERAKAAATDAVEHARGSVVSLSTTAPTPCAVCGRPTRSGDGGACGDVGDMAGKEPKEGPRRCYSCLTAAENEQVEATRKQQHETLDSFFAGEPPPVHVDPEETSLEKAHRLGSLALGGAVDLMGWIPGVGSITKGTIQVLHKVVKFGPLALYSAELVETLQLLVVMANRTGAAKVAEDSDASPKRDLEEDVKILRLFLFYVPQTDAWIISDTPDLTGNVIADCGPLNEGKDLEQIWRVWDGDGWKEDHNISAEIIGASELTCLTAGLALGQPLSARSALASRVPRQREQREQREDPRVPLTPRRRTPRQLDSL